jgi:hypothetical protein
VKRFARFAPLLLVAALGAVWLVLGRHIPHDQTLHVVLGDAAPRVTEVRLGYAAADHESELTREATFQWAEGSAPRIVTHAPRLADGAYVVQIQLVTRIDSAIVTRRVKIEGSPVSIDVREAIP